MSPPVIVSAGFLTSRTIIIRTLPINLTIPNTASCIFNLGNHTVTTGCQEVTVIQDQARSLEDCPVLAAAISTMGGQSGWSRFKLSKAPTTPVLAQIQKIPGLLKGSDKVKLVTLPPSLHYGVLLQG